MPRKAKALTTHSARASIVLAPSFDSDEKIEIKIQNGQKQNEARVFLVMAAFDDFNPLVLSLEGLS